MDQDANFAINPEHARTGELQEWWKNLDQSQLKSVNQGKTGDNISSKLESGRLIAEMNEIF